MKPTIFLDFDGPLRNLRVSTCGFETDPVLAATLHQTLNDLAPLGSQLVVSSSWRHMGREACVAVLDAWAPKWTLSPFLGLGGDWCISGGEWADATPSSAHTRANNIMGWVLANAGFSLANALVIDDYPLHRFLPPYVTTVICDEVDGVSGRGMRKIVDWKRAMLEAGK